MKALANYPSGETGDFFAFNADGEVWDPTANAGSGAFVAWADADYQNYRIAATEIGSSGVYAADLPEGTVSAFFAERKGTLDETVQHKGWVELARLDARVSSRASADELAKVPRRGETFRHRQVASDGANESADVIIEDTD